MKATYINLADGTRLPYTMEEFDAELTALLPCLTPGGFRHGALEKHKLYFSYLTREFYEVPPGGTEFDIQFLQAVKVTL